MPLTTVLEDAACKSCGGDVVWWTERETGDALEVFVDCADRCGAYHPKRVVRRTEDTSRDALKEVARDIAA